MNEIAVVILTGTQGVLLVMLPLLWNSLCGRIGRVEEEIIRLRADLYKPKGESCGAD